LATFGPKAVCEQIIVDSAVSLYVVVSAMMIGQNQTVRRNDLSGAASAENNDGIFQRNRIGVVNILGADFEPETFHLFDILLFQQGEQPHTFIGMSHGK